MEGKIFGAKDVKKLRGEIVGWISYIHSKNNYVSSIKKEDCNL